MRIFILVGLLSLVLFGQACGGSDDATKNNTTNDVTNTTTDTSADTTQAAAVTAAELKGKFFRFTLLEPESPSIAVPILKPLWQKDIKWCEPAAGAKKTDDICAEHNECLSGFCLNNGSGTVTCQAPRLMIMMQVKEIKPDGSIVVLTGAGQIVDNKIVFNTEGGKYPPAEIVIKETSPGKFESVAETTLFFPALGQAIPIKKLTTTLTITKEVDARQTHGAFSCKDDGPAQSGIVITGSLKGAITVVDARAIKIGDKPANPEAEWLSLGTILKSSAPDIEFDDTASLPTVKCTEDKDCDNDDACTEETCDKDKKTCVFKAVAGCKNAYSFGGKIAARETVQFNP